MGVSDTGRNTSLVENTDSRTVDDRGPNEFPNALERCGSRWPAGGAAGEALREAELWPFQINTQGVIQCKDPAQSHAIREPGPRSG